jgi:hypothetical protein
MALARLARPTLAWVVALAVGWAALALLGSRSRDPDSRLYAEIAARMSTAPAAGWIAPEFPPGWFMSGRFREHPVGLFVPAALLAKAGYPAADAAYALNALYQVLTLVLLQCLAAVLVDGLEARALGWLLQLLPIAFTYRVRANQEQAVLLCLVAALLGTAWSRRSPRWAALTTAALVGLLLVKGLLAVFGPALCALFILAARRDTVQPAQPERAAWAGLVVAVAAMAGAALLYELLYRLATGEPFWTIYISRQLGPAAVARDGSLALGKAYNFVWYLGRVAWFAFPWSLTLLASEWYWRRPRGRESTDAGPGAGPARAGATFVAGMVLLYVGLFSLSDRLADRYIFPAYYAVGCAGAVAAVRMFPRFRRFVERLDRPWVPAAVWCLTLAVHVVGGRLGLPTVNLR